MFFSSPIIMNLDNLKAIGNALKASDKLEQQTRKLVVSRRGFIRALAVGSGVVLLGSSQNSEAGSCAPSNTGGCSGSNLCVSNSCNSATNTCNPNECAAPNSCASMANTCTASNECIDGNQCGCTFSDSTLGGGSNTCKPNECDNGHTCTSNECNPNTCYPSNTCTAPGNNCHGSDTACPSGNHG